MAARHTSYEPLPRYGHAAAAVNNKLHMWGGWAGSEEESQMVAQKLEVFDISTELSEQKLTHGTPPPGVWYTAYAVVGSCLFVFGGLDHGGSRHNSLYKLNLRSFQWEQVQISNPSSGPQRKSGCGMVSYGDTSFCTLHDCLEGASCSVDPGGGTLSARLWKHFRESTKMEPMALVTSECFLHCSSSLEF